MSRKSNVAESDILDYLLAHSEQYRDLLNEYRKSEARLIELASLHYANNDEQLEETILKKKKLLLKDRMEEIASAYKQHIQAADVPLLGEIPQATDPQLPSQIKSAIDIVFVSYKEEFDDLIKSSQSYGREIERLKANTDRMLSGLEAQWKQ